MGVECRAILYNAKTLRELFFWSTSVIFIYTSLLTAHADNVMIQTYC